MQIEFEVKFIDVDIDNIRHRLEAAGAILLRPMRLMRRAIIEQPEHAADHSFIRIRDEGDKTTLTFKRRANQAASTIDSVKEIEVEVSDFDTTVELFREAGWDYATFQENRRETWQLDNAEVVIDEWPWLKPYIEIEAGSEEEVKAAAAKLDLSWDDVLIGHIDAVYATQYTFAPGFRGVIDCKEVLFNDPLPKDFQG